jgi:ClpP class serine protease
VGLEANAHILQEEEFEKERQKLSEEMQAKKREMADAIAAERNRSKEATQFLEKQQVGGCTS